MNDYLDANRTLWDAWTQLHAESPFYDLPGFKAGKSSLRKIEADFSLQARKPE